MTESRDRVSERKIKEKIERIYIKNECKEKKEKNYTIVGDLIERLPEMVDIIHIKRKKKKQIQ
jgi:hypothetical protein